jgi:hypothetical protein
MPGDEKRPLVDEPEPAQHDGSEPRNRFDLHLEADRTQVEARICQLPGVTAARVVPGYERAVDELHVVTVPGKGAKQIVRDVQSLLYATFGIPLDHRVISVVQLESPEEMLGPRRRVTIQRVTAVHEWLEVRVTVQLAEGGEEYLGEASGPASAAGRRRATARATLAAARPLLADRHVIEVEGVAIEQVLGHDLAISFVHFHGAHGERTISGTALVREDEAAAIARSVLDAINRELTMGD